MFFRFSAHRRSTNDSSVSRLSKMMFSERISSILGELELKSIRCSLLPVFKLAITALYFESNYFGTISFFSYFCSSFSLLEVCFVIDNLSTELKQVFSY